MIRRLLALVLAFLAGWWLLRRSRRTEPAPKRTRRPRAEVEGPMVRDRVCNTFLPRRRALTLESGGEEHYFCSEACRDKHLTAAR